MAVAYESVANTAFTSIDGQTPAISFTKPTGLAAGDLMVAVIGVADFNMGGLADEVSGWTKLGVVSQGTNITLVGYSKTADASDAAASNFSLTLRTGNTAGTNDYVVGSLYRISGTAPVTGTALIDTGVDTDGGTTNSYTGGVDPLVANNLLIMMVLGKDALATVSNYAVVTSNPTWTERQDVNVNDTTDYSFATATAPRTESTATGNFSADFSSSVSESAGFLIAVIETTSVNVSPAVIEATATINAPTVAAGASVSPSVITATATINAPTVTTAAPKWSNPDKSSAPSWVNPDKSA